MPRYLGHQKIRNEVANLPQQIQFGGGWNVLVVIFHPDPCGRAKQNVPAFSQILWDG
ncbi:MAG TPA: hypothetical protein VFC44_21595 [Candidatus Saccharimonadales bacterium]|nr:hypothetical protein [Candidatus Saccharimonadales bacterium]